MIADDVCATRLGGQTTRPAWAWWLAMASICVVPFLSSWRVGPLSGVYLETGALLFAVLLAGYTALSQTQVVAMPRATVYWLMLALFLVVQARWMDVPYESQSDLTAAVMVGLALLSWAARVWVGRIGQTQAVAVLAWALLVGAYLQSMVTVLQFIGETAWLPGLLSAPAPHQVFGQLGQRNHLGHYLTWGVLALCYLWHERRLSGWLALLLLLWLAGVMGLVGSRTIIAYIMVLGLALGFWRWQGGVAANRLIAIVTLAIGLVLLSQFMLSPLMSWLGGVDFASGAERMGSSFEQSGRDYEWQKAWHIFLAAPWWGHGWGGYAYQGFAQTGGYVGGFRPYETGVLFTHCHNLLLQLLVELGAVGTALVVLGFGWVVWPLVRRPFSAASMVLSLMLLVSLTHSMLEYPLWYVYFLVVFALVAALSPAPEPMDERRSLLRWPLLVLSLTMAMEMLRMGVGYQGLLLAAKPSNDAHITEQRAQDLHLLRHQHYWLHYYIDMVLVQKVPTELRPLPAWGQQAADLTARYRPYSNTYVRAMYLAEHGHADQAKTWLQQMGHYYPSYLPYYRNQWARLWPDSAVVVMLENECQAYASISKQPGLCKGRALF